ncbi:MAG: DUF4363 family protein [Clostridia bacterium]|nr:DUF4363 family protein [Clostridia bacterium]
MKILHYINFVIIILLLAGICVAEEVVVSGSLKQVQTNCLEIEKIVDERENLKNMEVVLAVDNLEYNWGEDEKNMCYMVNHKSVQEIGSEIAKLKMYIADDDVANFRVSIQVIKLHCHDYLHFMGANMHNVL